MDSLIRAFAPYVKILNDLDELTSFNANNGHWGTNRPFGRKNAILEKFGKTLIMNTL